MLNQTHFHRKWLVCLLLAVFLPLFTIAQRGTPPRLELPVQAGGWHVIGSAGQAGTQVTVETTGPGHVIRVTVNTGGSSQTYTYPLLQQVPWAYVIPPISPVCASDPCVTIVGISQAGANWSATPGFTPGGVFCFPSPWNICIYFGTFCPSVSGPGTFGFTLNNASASDTEFITVNPGPAVGTWGPFAGGCEGDDPFALSPPLCGGVSGTFSGPGLNASGIFDPQAAGAGTHTIFYTCTDANGCSTTISTTITLSPADWHHSTFDAKNDDEGIAVDVDAEGDVYFAGNHVDNTRIDGILNEEELPEGGMFLAKYDACGEMEWVANVTRFSATVNDIAVDDLNDVVYAVGNANSSLAAQFGSGSHNTYPGCGNIGFSSPGNTNFIAQWDKNTGCLNWVRPVLTGAVDSVKAIDVDRYGNVFIGLQIGAAGFQRIGIVKFTFANAAAGPPTWGYGSTLASGGIHRINALHVHDPLFGNARITITGAYDTSIEFPGAPLHTNIYGVTDCYVVRVVDGGSSVSLLWDQYANANVYAEGFDLDADFGGNVAVIGCFTTNLWGSFSGTWSNFTAWPSCGFFGRLTGGTGVANYVCQVAPAGGGHAKGKGIGVHGNYLHMTGSFQDFPLVSVCASPYTAAPFVGTPGEDKTFIITADWASGAWSGVSVTENGLAFANDLVTDNNGYSYITGAYSGTMDFQNSNPTLGSMTSSFGNFTNAFLLRGRPATGLLERTEASAFADDCQETEGVKVCWENTPGTISENAEFSLSSNPGNGLSKLSWENVGDGVALRYRILDTKGQVVLDGSVNSDQREAELDIQNQPAGMYFIYIQAGSVTKTIKMIKQ